MIDLLPAEIRRQTGRRGSFWGATLWCGLFGLGVLLWVLLSSDDSGEKAVSNGTDLLIFALGLASIVIGATAGSYDVDQGIMRYLVMTGRPRWQLVLVRIPGLIATIVLVSLPALLMVLLASLIASSPVASGATYLDLFYSVWMTGILYGLLSLAIGMFLKSSGVAIAVAVVVNFAGVLIASIIVEYVSRDVGNAFFSAVSGTVIMRDPGSGPDASYGVGVSAVLVVLWLGLLFGAALARVQRTEY